MPDAHGNFAYSTVATAPSPATSGTSLVVATGEGARFPAVPFNAVVWPAGSQPLSTNAEIVRVTNISTDTLTITRTQESTSARTIGIGDQIMAAITAKTLTDIEPYVISVTPSTDQNDFEPTDWARAKTVRVANTAPMQFTGFKAGSAGEQKTFIAAGNYPFLICDEAVTSSSAANRVKVANGIVAGHLAVPPGGAVTLEYDGTSSRWRCVAAYIPHLQGGWTHRFIRTRPNSTAMDSFGCFLSTEATPSGVGVASGSFLSTAPSVELRTATSSGASAGWRTSEQIVTTGGGSNQGGFIVCIGFGGMTNPANAGSCFIGIRNAVAAIGNVEASSLVNIFGVGTDSTGPQSTFRRLVNDGSGTATANDLGTGYEWDADNCYELMLFGRPNSTELVAIMYRTDDLSVVPKLWLDTTNVPSAGTAFTATMHVGNRAAAAAYGIAFMRADIYTRA